MLASALIYLPSHAIDFKRAGDPPIPGPVRARLQRLHGRGPRQADEADVGRHRHRVRRPPRALRAQLLRQPREHPLRDADGRRGIGAVRQVQGLRRAVHGRVRPGRLDGAGPDQPGRHQHHHEEKLSEIAERQLADRSYEWKTVTLLSLGFGLVGLDRWIIAPLFPFMMKDLGVGYQDLGNLIAVLGLFWGVSAIITGAASDRIGRRKILIPAIVLFSLLSGLSGLATGLLSLLLIRSVMGVTEGSFCPASVAATRDTSPPSPPRTEPRPAAEYLRAVRLGLRPDHCYATLTSGSFLALGLRVSGDSRLGDRSLAAFGNPRAGTRDAAGGRDGRASLGHGDPQPQCRLSDASAPVCHDGRLRPRRDDAELPPRLFAPHAATDGLHHVGHRLGGFLEQSGVAGASDILGRRTAAILSFVAACAFLIAFISTGTEPVRLFALLFCLAFCCFGLLALLTGPVATGAVPLQLISSSVGIVSGTGEIFGGGVARRWPATSPHISESSTRCASALAGLAAGILVSLFLKETAPRKLATKIENKPIEVAP